MRVLDDRYSRDWGRLNLALRFLMHEARTRTICMWTGLTQDRIRSLYRDYMNGAGNRIPRHRGKSPQTVAFFTRSLRVQQETAVLASLLCLNGVVPTLGLRQTCHCVLRPVRARSLGNGQWHQRTRRQLLRWLVALTQVAGGHVALHIRG